MKSVTARSSKVPPKFARGAAISPRKGEILVLYSNLVGGYANEHSNSWKELLGKSIYKCLAN